MKIDESRLRLFAQDEYYIRSWHDLNNGKSGRLCFNPFALLFGTAWCFYRKLYAFGLVYLITGIMAATLGYLVYPPETAFSAKVVPLLSVLLLARLPLSLITDTVYYRKAVKVINRYETDAALSEADRAFFIEDAGGTSVGGLLLALVLSVAMRLFDSAIPSQAYVSQLRNIDSTAGGHPIDMDAFLYEAQADLPLTDTCPADVMPNWRNPAKNPSYSADFCLDNENVCFNDCLNGDAKSCYNLAIHIQRSEDPNTNADAVFEALFLEACKLGSMSGCTNRAAGMEYRSDTPAVRQCALKTYEKTCAFNDPWGCTMYAGTLGDFRINIYRY
ncbi:MAG: DUF2628 domain-containing protein [Gammaproteobacteria bacterium]